MKYLTTSILILVCMGCHEGNFDTEVDTDTNTDTDTVLESDACGDGIDNDSDGDADCQDIECQTDEAEPVCVDFNLCLDDAAYDFGQCLISGTTSSMCDARHLTARAKCTGDGIYNFEQCQIDVYAEYKDCMNNFGTDCEGDFCNESSDCPALNLDPSASIILSHC